MIDKPATKTARRFARTPAVVNPLGTATVLSNDSRAEEPAPAVHSKISKVLTLLGRDEGATLAEIAHATSWQAHTVRAALTGLRKKGHAIERTKRDDASCYRARAQA